MRFLQFLLRWGSVPPSGGATYPLPVVQISAATGPGASIRESAMPVVKITPTVPVASFD